MELMLMFSVSDLKQLRIIPKLLMPCRRLFLSKTTSQILWIFALSDAMFGLHLWTLIALCKLFTFKVDILFHHRDKILCFHLWLIRWLDPLVHSTHTFLDTSQPEPDDTLHLHKSHTSICHPGFIPPLTSSFCAFPALLSSVCPASTPLVCSN